MSALMSVRDLRVTLPAPREASLNEVVAVDGTSFEIGEGEIVALVGESGSGKSMTAMAIMRLLPSGARAAGSVLLAGREQSSLAERELQRVRGRELGLVFQDPSAALNPVYSVGWQVTEAVRLARGLRGRAAKQRARELLTRVGFPPGRFDHHVHELSGGMRQRVMIAIALAGDPRLVIADEPTTSLDLLAAAQICTLLADLRRERGLALLLISHDLAMVGTIADRVLVMYAGEIIEHGPVEQVLTAPQHPYTRALLACVPPRRTQPKRREPSAVRLVTIQAAAGPVGHGCRFEPRCALAMPRCKEHPPMFPSGASEARCFLLDAEPPREVT